MAPLYTFYSFNEAGAPVTMQALECATEDAAMTHVDRVLKEHLSASRVTVCIGDTEIATQLRTRDGSEDRFAGVILRS